MNSLPNHEVLDDGQVFTIVDDGVILVHVEVDLLAFVSELHLGTIERQAGRTLPHCDCCRPKSVTVMTQTGC